MITKTNTTSSVLQFFLNYVGHSLIGLTILTDARVKKTNNPYIKDKEIILKKTRLLANVGFQYSNSLNSQAKREGKEIDFDVKPRRWGIRLPTHSWECRKMCFTFKSCKI